jgi:ABC-2 type transport system permease protein
MRALIRLTWLEIKIFAREPLGVFGTVGIPVIVFLVLSSLAGPGLARAAARPGGAVPAVIPVSAALMMALGAVSSLVTIISIYREGGILKRLRATPLSPLVILSAHVIVKLLFTAITLAVMVLAGRQYFPPGTPVPVVSFGVALLFSTWSILSIGFLIASIVPTARFAQPVAALILYPLVGLSGQRHRAWRSPGRVRDRPVRSDPTGRLVRTRAWNVAPCRSTRGGLQTPL